MRYGIRVLRLYTVGARPAERERAALLVDRLSSRRKVSGDGPEWRVLYECRDVSEAMRLCAEDLSEIDPAWLEILDFEAVPSRPIRGVEFG
jgi:hypothetical protein